MTSRNINKIVQSNLNLKPWMLSRNTNEIVNAYVQKIYKRMPTSFNKDIKTCKVAGFRPENRGPLSTLKHLEKELPLATITPRRAAIKKSTSKMKQQTNNLMNYLQISNKGNQQISSKFPNNNLTPSKRLLKTPNYKIYRSLRHGSSTSSSRSSLFKRYDERKRQRQSNPAQINYLIRSFHTGKFEPTYARFLMPARNQQLESNLGSIPDAVKFSNDMLKDLMKINRITRPKISLADEKKIKVKHYRLDEWNHPPTLSKIKIKIPKDSAIKHVSSNVESSIRRSKLSPEHREHARLNVGRLAQFRHPRPPNELFTAEHDRKHTELHEKHRRNRMKKLGLIKSPTASEKEFGVLGDSSSSCIKLSDAQYNKVIDNEISLGTVKTESAYKYAAKNSPRLCSTPKTIGKELNGLVPDKQENSTATRTSLIPIKTNTNTTKAAYRHNSAGLSNGYNSISPIVAARAQMYHKTDLRSYRYNRSDFFSTKKY